MDQVDVMDIIYNAVDVAFEYSSMTYAEYTAAFKLLNEVESQLDAA